MSVSLLYVCRSTLALKAPEQFLPVCEGDKFCEQETQGKTTYTALLLTPQEAHTKASVCERKDENTARHNQIITTQIMILERKCFNITSACKIKK